MLEKLRENQISASEGKRISESPSMIERPLRPEEVVQELQEFTAKIKDTLYHITEQQKALQQRYDDLQKLTPFIKHYALTYNSPSLSASKPHQDNHVDLKALNISEK